MRRVKVSRSGRDAKILTLSYESSDPELTAAVPNLITEQFVTRRSAAQKSVAGSTITFLKRQLDTLAQQLQSAEAALLNYRQRERVVNPTVEGSTQVTRMIQLQSERSSVETERAALAQIVREVERAAATKRPDDPSPYRNLLSFPTLLRNQSTSRLLDALVSVEGQRTELLARRTPADPDVQTLTARIKSIEGELHSVATTYLEGLTHQVTGIDSALGEFGRQLQQVPQRELHFARLERQPKLLEEMYALLQTRLKEAEIAQAANDLSVQVVDPAIRPRRPVRPRPMLNLLLGMMLGGLIGTGAGFLREVLDKTVHTRADIMTATGLSVIGLIPRIPRGRSRLALISKKQLPRSTAGRAAPAPRTGTYTAPASPSAGYTFLNSEQPGETRGPEPSPSQSEPLGRIAPVPGVPHVVVSETGTAGMEAYASLLTNLSFSLAENPPRVLAFTSGLPGEGKTTNAVNLSLALAHRGSTVLLVDCDLRRGLLHTVFEGPREPGLTNLLWGQVSFEDARRRIAVDPDGVLDYLTTGGLPPNPTSLVESPTMRNLLTWWRDQYDYVILDTPPVNVITDAALLGAHADGVVLVARAGVTHATSLGYALEQLRRVRAQVLGVVLSDIDFSRDAAYDPTYRYHQYSYGNGKS
jgi:tyrosine-protein kinase Etk/Wzc